MDTQALERAKSTRLAKLKRTLFGCWMLLGVSPFLLGIFGLQYLPTVGWAAWSMGAAVGSGIISAAVFMWAAVMLAENKENEVGDAKKALAVFAFPLIGLFIGYSAVMTGGPMIVAVLAGDEVEHTFTLTDVSMARSRKCPNAITIDQLPFYANRLCRIPEDVRKTLSPGARVAITGRGSKWGVFARQIRRVD